MFAAPAAPAAPARAHDDCPAFRWTTLGTAGGPVPTADRAEPSNLLNAGRHLILVDSGDGTVNQLAGAGLPVGAVGTVFISHLHWDHVGGLGAVIGLRWMNGYPGRLVVYGPPGTRQVVDGIVASLRAPAQIGFGLGSAGADPAETVSVTELQDGDQLELGPLKVRAASNSHFDRAVGSSILSFSYRFDLGDRSIIYTGDTGPSNAVAALAKGGDLLVSEVIALEPLVASIRANRPDMTDAMATDMWQHLATHHLSPKAIGQLAQVAQVRHLVLTHYAIPGPLERYDAILRSDVRLAYAGPLDLARDLSTFDVGCES